MDFMIDNNIEEDYVSFRLAKLLVNKECHIFHKVGMESALYTKKGEPTTYANYGIYYSGLSDGYTSRPTLNMAVKWVWENHHLNIESLVSNNKWGFEIYKEEDGRLVYSSSRKSNFKNRAEAVEAGIIYTLKNLI